jgi:hypothetical protein
LPLTTPVALQLLNIPSQLVLLGLPLQTLNAWVHDFATGHGSIGAAAANETPAAIMTRTKNLRMNSPLICKFVSLTIPRKSAIDRSYLFLQRATGIVAHLSHVSHHFSCAKAVQNELGRYPEILGKSLMLLAIPA